MEGLAGIGKTEFLDVIRQNLTRNKIWLVKVNGSPQEMFRPYLDGKNLIRHFESTERQG